MDLAEKDLAPEPERLGPYRIARRLGRGGMGEVFLAWDERLGRRVALKRIRRDGPVTVDRERFRREAWAAARLSHPSVVQVYDLFEAPSGDAIVLEYVEGRTLRELLAEGSPALAVTLRLAREIAEGLAAAHAAGLVHRDLKAENVMVTADGRAKILDFGLAKPLLEERGEGLTAQGVLLGTLHAMSPEQARGQEIDARSDLFSLGVLLYEMLTGLSPFRGGDALETLQRIVTESPLAVSSLRPEVPGALSDLVRRLLAKDRENRPGGAAEVVRELADLAASSSSAAEIRQTPAADDVTWRDLPTAFSPAPVRTPPPVSSARLRRPAPLVLATVLALLMVALLGVAWVWRTGAPDSVRVLVLEPRTPSGGESESGLLASGLLTAALSSLSSLEGLAPLEPAQSAPGVVAPVEAARAAAADEVLLLALETDGGGEARVSLRRIQGSDGRVLHAESFPIPAGGEDRDLRLVADALAVHLRRAWSDRRPRPGTPELEVRDQDYAELLRIKERLGRGSADLEPELARLEKIVRGSPRFLEAHLLLVQVADSLFTSNRDAGALERATQAAQAAGVLAPDDPRPLEARFRVSLTAGRYDEAQATLDEMSRSFPGDPQLHRLASRLAESRGDLDAAVREAELAVRRAPSWLNLFQLADLEVRTGQTAAAREHLQELLERSPGNPWGLDKLGGLELRDGDPRRAAEIYLELIRHHPQRPFYTNLGLAHSLLGRHAEAAEAYRAALALDPGHPRALLNLADAELAQGRQAAARQVYRRALERFEEMEKAGPLSAKDAVDKAQCLAHLGRVREAVELTQRTLRESGDDSEVFYAASLVYALAGDRASALVNAQLALDGGMEPLWFTLPVFGALRDDPELRALLDRALPPS